MGINTEEMIAELKQSDRSLLPRIVKALAERHPVDFQLQSALSEISETTEVTWGIMKISDMSDNPTPLKPLWFGIYPGKVTLFIGETGAGKSSLFYNIAIHAAKNEPLWECEFGLGTGIKVLYIDPENAGNYREGDGGLCAVKIRHIGRGKPENFASCDANGLNLSKATHMNWLRNYVSENGVQLVVMDPITNLFDTKDENDNSEAARQMKSITQLSRDTGAAVVIVHHTGKDNSGNFGRGASSRLGACDVGVTFRAKGSAEAEDDTFGTSLIPRSDFCRLQIVKNRLGGKGSLYLQMAGEDRFVRTKIENWRGAARSGEGAVPKMEQAKEEILRMLEDGNWHDRKSLIEAMKEAGIGERNASEALKSLTDAKGVCQRQKAKGKAFEYALLEAKESANDDAAMQNPKNIALLQYKEDATEDQPELFSQPPEMQHVRRSPYDDPMMRRAQ